MPHCYFTADGARRDKDGYLWIMGRVDDVLNVAGHRLSTMEVESALVHHPKVAEAAVVGKPDDIKGEAIACFVTLKTGNEPSEELKKELRDHVAKEIGALARPDEIRFTEGLPKTRSGKIMRRLLRDVAANRHDDRRRDDAGGSQRPGEIAGRRGMRAFSIGAHHGRGCSRMMERLAETRMRARRPERGSNYRTNSARSLRIGAERTHRRRLVR